MNLFSIKGVAYIISAVFLVSVISYLEYDDFRMSGLMFPVLWLVLGGGFVWIIFKQHVIIGAFMALVFLFISAVVLLANFMCANSLESYGYTNGQDKSLKIEIWTMDCGAWDSSPSHNYYKALQLTGHIKWVTKIDKAEIDTAKWEFGNLR